ncbi:uncharacterized protein LOC130756749 isoform X1 [Actinidia eriantha]|uniref:uncharacterized protein LOC130756749 isoform X1 n=1 Tax=Actinidia eriantha TaxID=165200 RepID=UPI0025857D7F|nr:uncharacterized protein LOC130756749 isoform X1 [Actinidia eriantha]
MEAASSLFHARNNDPLRLLLSSSPSTVPPQHHIHIRHHPNLIHRFPYLSLGKVDSTRLLIHPTCLDGFNLKCCSHRCKRIDNYQNYHHHQNNNNISTNHLHHNNNAFRDSCVLGDSEIGLEDDCSAAAANKLINGYSGSPLGFPAQSISDKIVAAVDVDEVLGNFISALNRFIADRYSLNHSLSEYYVYEFFKIWNCSRDEADIRVHEFFKTSYFKTGIHPIPGARQALQKLSRFCNLSVVTSRQNAIRDHTIDWIENHYPGLFQEIHFGNHFALEGQPRLKSDICRSLGAKVLIDDNPRYAIECAEVGIRVLLFDFENSYPWCKIDSVDQHPLVTKVNSWEDVEHQLVSWIVS